jgi:hypothetical protein
MGEMRDRIAAVLKDAQIGYAISLTRLVDGVCTYEAVVGDEPPQEFRSHAEALEYVTGKKWDAVVDLVFAELRNPTESMILAGENAEELGDTECCKHWWAMVDEARR